MQYISKNHLVEKIITKQRGRCSNRNDTEGPDRLLNELEVDIATVIEFVFLV